MEKRRATAVLVLLLGGSSGAWSEPALDLELPQAGAAKHLGVRTCSGAPCHGNQAAVGQRVRQNEYTTWSLHDRHSRAYDVLQDEPSRSIGAKLRLPVPPHESPLCLDCHADHIVPERRGERFALEDGVGCEACHGGAEPWINEHHTGGRSHRDLVELGMFPTDDPVARAELCLSCHRGTDRKFVRHRLYGAGHPRLRFELDTFTTTQPAHFDADDDYSKRGKRADNAARTWAIGQAATARNLLQALADGRRKHGIWPEVAHVDCYACHHPLSELRWSPRPSLGVAARPGVARLDDASLVLLVALLDVIEPELASRLRAGTRALHGAYSAGTHDATRTVTDLRGTLDLLAAAVGSWSPNAEQVRAVALAVIDAGTSGAGRDYLTAEQVAMAVQALAQGLVELGALGDATLRAIDVESTQLLETTRDPERYEPQRAEATLRRLRLRLSGIRLGVTGG